MRYNRVRLLQQTPILGGVRDDIMHFLLDIAVDVVVLEGDLFFAEGEPGDRMYVLETGRVVVLKRRKEIDYRLNTLDVGDCIGEMSLIDLGPRSASVLAMTECRAIEISFANLLDLYERDLEQFTLIQMNMAREVSRRLRLADESRFQDLVTADEV